MEPIAITVQILGKDYRVSCLSHEREALITSAKFLNERMREIKNTGKVVGTERVAVMAALNLSHELLQRSAEDRERSRALKSRLQGLQERLEVAIDANSQLQM